MLEAVRSTTRIETAEALYRLPASRKLGLNRTALRQEISASVWAGPGRRPALR